eukprot:1158756-Pelagomonas_calceolata.AAC.4
MKRTLNLSVCNKQPANKQARSDHPTASPKPDSHAQKVQSALNLLGLHALRNGQQQAVTAALNVQCMQAS